MTGLTHPAAAHGGPQLDNRRVLAAALDLLLLVPVAALLAMVTGGFGGVSAALTVAWALFYYFALESGGGQTVGKRLLRLRVVRSDGSEAGLREVAVRTVLRTVDGLFGYLVGLAVMLASGERRQRLGDLAAGTVVTSADAEPAGPPPTAAVAAPPAEPIVEEPRPEDEEDGVPVVEPSEPEPEVEDEAPLLSVDPAESDPDDERGDEPEPPVPTAEHAAADEEEATSMGSGVEIVSAIDLIMADAQEVTADRAVADDAADEPLDDAGDETARP